MPSTRYRTSSFPACFDTNVTVFPPLRIGWACSKSIPCFARFFALFAGSYSNSTTTPHSACHRFDIDLTLLYHHIDISPIACICHAMVLIRRTRQFHTHTDGRVARSVRRDATRWMPDSLSYQLASSGNTTEEPRYRAFQYWRAPHSSTVAGGREFSVNRSIGRRSPARGAGVCGNHAFMRIISQGERWNFVILEYWSRVRFGENSARLAH